MLKLAPAIIFDGEAKLGAHVASSHAFEKFPGFGVSEVDQKGKYSISLAINNKLSITNCMARKKAKISWPPFGGHRIGSIDDKLIRLFIKSGRGHQSQHIRPMTNFCLTIGAHYFHFFGKGYPFGILLGS